MGLMYLMVCLTVGIVVLTASTAAAGKLADLRKREQDYLNVASAARLVRERICALTYTYTATYNNGADEPEVNLDGGAFKTPGGEPMDDSKVILSNELKKLCDILAKSKRPDASQGPLDTNALQTELDEAETTFQIIPQSASGGGSSGTEWTVYGNLSMKTDGRIIVELWAGDEDKAKGNNHMAIEFCPDGPVETEEKSMVENSATLTKQRKVTTALSWPESGCTITKGGS